MAAYPEHLVKCTRLRDGTPVTLRPIRPEDAAMESAFVRGLSEEARYFRFMDMLRELTPRMLEQLTRIDYDRHLALVAIAPDAAGEREVGVARFVVNPDNESCEFAIVVADDWQGRGLAGLLMAHLIEAARARGLKRMVGDVLGANTRMLRFVRGLGFTTRVRPDDPGVIEVAKEL